MESQTPDLDAVVKRLEKVEAQNRRLKWAGVLIVAVVLTCTGLLIWQGVWNIRTSGIVKAETVEARGFILRGADARRRAELKVEKKLIPYKDAEGKTRMRFDEKLDHSVLRLFDGDGLGARVSLYAGEEPSLLLSGPLLGDASLGVSADGPNMSLQRGKSYAHLDISANGSAELFLWDSETEATAALRVLGGSPQLSFGVKGKSRVELSASDSLTHLHLYDMEGKFRTRLSASPGLSLFDADGKYRMVLSLWEDGAGALHLFDADWKLRAGLTVEDGAPGLNLYDAEGNHRAALGSTSLETVKTGAVTKTAPSSLVLFDKEGKVIFKAP